jgi:4-amino-4-deoxy-L-arabinose transferase-like glycosyltransferase
MRLALVLLLIAVAIGAFFIRFLSIAEPLGIDQSLWASAANGMVRGQRLYHDVWEQRPPGIYWIYVAGFRVFGRTAATVAWLDILASAASCTLLFLVTRLLSTTRTAALVAALFATLTMPGWLYGHGGFLERSVCETFIVPCVAFGALSAAYYWRHPSLKAAVLLGLAGGAAAVLKPNAGLYCPMLLVWILLYAERRQIARMVAAVIAGGAIVPLLALLWLWRLDILHDARVAVIDFNRYYVSEGFTLGAYTVTFSKALWLRIKTDPLWLAGAIGSCVALWDLARRRKLPPLPGLAVIWGCAAAIVIVVNGARLFNSYFMNALPPLALMAGWFLGDAAWSTRARRALGVATLVLMAFLLIHRDYAGRVSEWARLDWQQLRGQIDSRTYLERFGDYGKPRGYAARANAELAEYVASHTQPDERIFLFGISGAGVYFGSDRLTAHRFLRANFFVETAFPDPDFRLGSVIADLSVSRPRYLIFERLHTATTMANAVDNLPNDPAVQALLRGYRLETSIEDFTLYRRVD